MSVSAHVRWIALLGGLAYPVSPSAAAMTRPFQVGGGESGGGARTGITGWLLNAQSHFTHEMSGYLRALPHDSAAFWSLILIGFVYGVFHAAGPGHGKAIIASYATANDRALKRGIVLAFLAAALQGLCAIVIVAVAAVLFATTAARMNQVADALATASACGIMAIGAWLAWTKGRALLTATQRVFERRAVMSAGALFAGASWNAAPTRVRFTPRLAFSPDLRSSDDCGHAHMLDPRQLSSEFSWRGAVATVVFAGARPCSGALLILVYALAQHVFWAGVAATFAMSLGTAITTGALATLSVFAKTIAVKAAGRESVHVLLVVRAFEFGAAVLVFLFGSAMLLVTSLAA